MAATAPLPPSHDRFEALVRQYGRLIGSAVARVGGRGAAQVREDVEQKVLVALWKQIEGEQTITFPASYIYKAAVRETVRAVRRERERQVEPLNEQDAAAAPLASGTPFEALHGREQARHIEESFKELNPDRERAVRAHLSGFDVDEIMRMYGWPYQKARNLVSRGMADLRQALRARGLGD
jgi:RNA polymerase sigma factor (sigma-70 family)